MKVRIGPAKLTLADMPDWTICKTKYAETVKERFRVGNQVYGMEFGELSVRSVEPANYRIIDIVGTIIFEDD